VIPAGFDYSVATSVEDAINQLTEGGEDAKALAGGHSLLPLMKMRLAFPTLLVDLRKLDELRGIKRSDGDFRIGALTTHAAMSQASELGLASQVAGMIADQQVRNRGTIGGSLAHGDPASDQLAVLLAAEGSVTVQTNGGGTREIAAADLFQDYLTTSIGEDEILTEVRLPALDGYGFAYEKFTRRAEDWAMCGVCVLVKQEGGQIADARIAFTNMASTPIRAHAAEQALRGQPADAASFRVAADAAPEGTDPPSDLNATPDYKRHLARVLTRRALERAAAAGG
jgi:carbon-monoxide dehydrogenase medium subunit